MEKQIPAALKELFKPQEPVDLPRIVAAIRSVPKKEWDGFFKILQQQQLMRLMSSSDLPSETLANTKAMNIIQSLFGEILG